MKNPLKRNSKSKEQILYEQKQQQETARKRKFVEETFLPLLRKHTTTIHQAKNVCKILQNDILSTFNEGMRQPVSSLDLLKKIEGQTDAGATAFRELIEAFNTVSIGEAAELIGGMPNAIEAAFSFEERSRTLEELEWDNGTLRVKKKE